MGQDESILALLDKVRAIGLEGVSYAKDDFDRERYQKLLRLVSKSYSGISGISSSAIASLLRSQSGNITPKLGIDIVLTRSDGRILILRRVGDSSWCFPGGWVDVGETALEAAVRELLEETSVVAAPDSLIGVVFKGPTEYKDIVFHQANLVLIAKVFGLPEVKLSHEHSEYRWIDGSESVNWHGGHEKVFDCYCRFRQNGSHLSIALK